MSENSYGESVFSLPSLNHFYSGRIRIASGQARAPFLKFASRRFGLSLFQTQNLLLDAI